MMRTFLATVALLGAPACQRPPARVAIGTSDTLVLHGRRPVHIPVRVLDATGRVMDSTGATFRWVSGDSIPVSSRGEVSCPGRGDATVRAAHGALTALVVVRCRPVRSLQMDGPLNLVLGDSAQEVRFRAIGDDGRPVEPLAGEAEIVDRSVATLEKAGGLRIRARKAGATLLEVRAGERYARAGVHVYERAGTLDGLRNGQQLVAVRLRLAGGDMRRWHIPAGGWMIAMVPERPSGEAPSFRIDGAQCNPALTERRYVCQAGPDASVTVYQLPNAQRAKDVTGNLLVRRLGGS
jgi:hypothetical protein